MELKIVCFILGLWACTVFTAPVTEQRNVRDILATIYSDYPGLKGDISDEEIEAVLALDISLQMQALKEVLKESDLDLTDLENYFMQDTTLTQEADDNTSLVTNTTIIGLPDTAVVQQSQQSYDDAGAAIIGGASAIEIEVTEDDSNNVNVSDSDDEESVSVLDDGAEKDKNASFEHKVHKIGEEDISNGESAEGNEILKRSEEGVLIRQKRNI